MEFNFKEIEDKWKAIWAEKGIYKVTEDPNKPKYYVLDMFPYPSGAGLHVGHPLGYVASDIYARYKRLKGYNVLHPMGYDAFGLPAEQYAIETGTHPEETTKKAIARYREQLDKIGFSYDWDRKVVTCEPAYYKWTQWIFLKLFGSWYNRETNKAELIETLIAKFEKDGTSPKLLRDGVDAFTADEWKGFTEAQKQMVLMNYRLAYLSYAEVNWCEALGTVLANDEVKDGKSERGGHPVVRRKMRQWFLRITEYSDRLLDGLNHLDWSEAMKEMQRNWIGRSEGALIRFEIATEENYAGELKRNGNFAYMTGSPDISMQNIKYAKDNRKAPTEAEDKLWQELRGEKLGHRFRRQHLIDKYIVDFVSLRLGLVIEVDGAVHDYTVEEDTARTERLNKLGFKVIRFKNNEVLEDINKVLGDIMERISILTPNPSPKERGEASPLGGGLEGEVHLEVFTTRPDTIFGATFMVIAAEHELVDSLTTAEQKDEVEKYIAYVKSRTDVERQQEKRVTGVFTGSYTLNPFNGEAIPVYIAEYVLAGYGTGAIMAVPADDERDRKFAEKFGLPIIEVIDKSMYPGATIEDKKGKMINSDFLNGMEVKDAIKLVIDEVEKRGIGQRKVNYKQRDAGYSRQRYWGEPFPIKYKVQGEPDAAFVDAGEHDDIPMPINESELPLVLPQVKSFKPGGDGRSPLANSEEWVKAGYETDTMPGYAGSSWYFLRYMDANNPNEFAAKDKIDYWKNVDIYFGGAEHAVGHLLYSRMWHKFLFDLGYVPTDEPFQKMVNQGMITGVTKLLVLADIDVLEYEGVSESGLPDDYSKETTIQVWGLVNHEGEFIHPTIELKKSRFFEVFGKKCFVNGRISPQAWRMPSWLVDEKNRISEINFNKLFTEEGYDLPNVDKEGNIAWVTENGQRYIQLATVVEKMSKSKKNVVNPDDVIDKYGADCFRMFEMFLGPIEQSKPWDDKGISGTYNFLRKFWRLFGPSQTLPEGEGYTLNVNDEEPTDAEYKTLYKTLKKVADDIERLNFNTCVSSFMIATNELTSIGCSKRKILEPLLIALAPLAPFVTEELWSALGHITSVHHAEYPKVEEKYLVESEHEYPISINGKVRAQIKLPLTHTPEEVQKQVLALDSVAKWTNGNEPKKFIFVKGKIINVVV